MRPVLTTQIHLRAIFVVSTALPSNGDVLGFRQESLQWRLPSCEYNCQFGVSPDSSEVAGLRFAQALLANVSFWALY